MDSCLFMASSNEMTLSWYNIVVKVSGGYLDLCWSERVELCTNKIMWHVMLWKLFCCQPTYDGRNLWTILVRSMCWYVHPPACRLFKDVPPDVVSSISAFLLSPLSLFLFCLWLQKWLFLCVRGMGIIWKEKSVWEPFTLFAWMPPSFTTPPNLN